MLNIKKIIASMVALAVLSINISAFAAYVDEKGKTVDNLSEPDNIVSNETMQAERFVPFGGTVTEINAVETDIFKATYVSVENEDGPATIAILDDTYIVDNAEIAIGDTVTCYYNVNGPMLMIYPPQYRAEVILVENQDFSVKLDRFDENLVSSDGQLKLNISDKTVITLQDGSIFDGELTNRRLVVSYTVTTRSIPAQTTPSGIVVLFEKAVAVAGEMAPNAPIEPFEKTLAESPIRVNAEIIDAPNAFVSASNTIMVPLRAIAEALEYEVGWDDESYRITIGSFITLKIGEDSYNFAKMAPIELKASPELVGDKTYVPLSFFSMIIKAETAAYINNEIIIDKAN